MSKLSDFLDKQKINQERLLAVSADLEKLRPGDRQVRLAQRRVRGGKASDAEKELAGKERRSGKPVSRPTLAAALRGDALHRKAKQRITKAVNAILAHKKKDAVQVTDLFG